MAISKRLAELNEAYLRAIENRGNPDRWKDYNAIIDETDMPRLSDNRARDPRRGNRRDDLRDVA